MRERSPRARIGYWCRYRVASAALDILSARTGRDEPQPRDVAARTRSTPRFGLRALAHAPADVQGTLPDVDQVGTDGRPGRNNDEILTVMATCALAIEMLTISQYQPTRGHLRCCAIRRPRRSCSARAYAIGFRRATVARSCAHRTTPTSKPKKRCAASGGGGGGRHAGVDHSRVQRDDTSISSGRFLPSRSRPP
jgi:hypothetical protein